jgi:hypothetical protein
MEQNLQPTSFPLEPKVQELAPRPAPQVLSSIQDSSHDTTKQNLTRPGIYSPPLFL